MYDPARRDREWRFYVRDMIEFCETVLYYTDGLDMDGFIADKRTYDATLRNIELIGEAATHIPSQVRDARPDIPWRVIIGMRNRLAHGYLHINDSVIWSTIQDAIPDALPKLRNLLDTATRD